MIILAIDPGIGKTGVCVYSTHILQVDLTKGELPAIPDNLRPTHAVIECPRVYPHSKVPPNDLLELAVLVGVLCQQVYERYGFDCKVVYPRDWKGTVKKQIHNARVLKNLHSLDQETWAQESKRFPKSKHNDVIDAIGLAKWHASGLKHV